jgi:hypothetical protein
VNIIWELGFGFLGFRERERERVNIIWELGFGFLGFESSYLTFNSLHICVKLIIFVYFVGTLVLTA